MDDDALRCKVVALIKADAIDRALLSIETASTKGTNVHLGFYKVEKGIIFLNTLLFFL